MKHVTLSLIILISIMMTACGQGGGSSGGAAGGPKPTFRVWTATSGGATYDLSGLNFSYRRQWVNPNFPQCLYEDRTDGDASLFTFKTVDITSPADPVCPDYALLDLTGTNDGTTLTVCFPNGTFCTTYY